MEGSGEGKERGGEGRGRGEGQVIGGTERDSADGRIRNQKETKSIVR